jgi:putative membrane-bound dehydrogenase-like protein
MKTPISLLALILSWSFAFAAPQGFTPIGKDVKPLNLDFEDGTLKDWTATGTAFDRQPIKGDTVAPRRGDMKSDHQGTYWIGTYEVGGDDPQGTLTSAPFKVTQPFASFLVAGGPWPNTRVELVRADSQEVFFKTSGYESENLRPVIVDLQPHLGREIFIRIVDKQSGHWGHINFDDFKLFAQRPVFSNALDPAKIAKGDDAPPPDVVPFAGLSPQEACDKATLPPGFKMHVFAAEPDVVQPIAFCLDHRGRVWVAEGITYPKRKGVPPKVEPPLTRPSDTLSPAEGETAGLRGLPDPTKPTPEQLKDIFGGADRILVFEDTDGDHKFDKRTVFMENLNLISGLEVGFGGVWIGAAPYLMFVPISDSEIPKPAGDPQILLDGWNFTADTHETLNTFTWGPDGWLYGCHGVFCPSHVGKPGAPESERQWCDAGVWRYHPTRHVFEIFTEGGSNSWGIDFDEYGQLWAEMCVIPHLFHMIQGARIERQGGQHYSVSREEIDRNEKYRDQGSRKPIYPFAYDDIKQHADHVHWAGSKGPHAANARSDAVGGGHAHAGVMCYLGKSWPAEYRGQLFLGNIHGQRLNMDIPERLGSGYVGHHGKDFLNFNDTWSQTLNQLYDQDGSVYIIDWYDKNQCHHTREDGHDRSNGRIYKIVYNDQKTTRVDLAKLGDEELLKLVPSKNEFMSRHARRVLQERSATLAPLIERQMQRILRSDLPPNEKPDSEAEAAWSRKIRWSEWAGVALSASKDVAENLRVLWLSHVAGLALANKAITNAAAGGDLFRAWRVQLAFERKIPADAVAILEMTRKLAPNGKNAYDQMLSMLLNAVRDESPVVRLYAASALQRIPPALRWEPLEALVLRSDDAKDHNLPLLYWNAAEPGIAAKPQRGLTLALSARSPRFLEFTTRRIATLGTTEARDLLAEKLATLDDPAKQLEMLTGLSAALKGQRSVPMPKGWEAIETKLGASLNAEARALVQSLSLTFGSQSALVTLRKTLSDGSAPVAARQAALDSLMSIKDTLLPPMLQALLKDADLRGPALRALAGYNDPKTPEAILAVYSTLDGAQKRDALSTLVSRPAFAKPLLVAVGENKLSKKDLTADVIRQLRNLKDPDIQADVGKIYGIVRETSADKKAEIEKYRRIYGAGGSQPGNASAGRVVFNKVCAQCHTLFDTGGKVGPELTGANRTDLGYLLENMVDPNAVIPNEYRASEIETKDDRSLTGIVKQQDDKSVTLQTANELLTIPRSEIATTRQGELSMMPEGLLAPLTDQEVRDLIYYLSRSGQVPLPAGSN